MAGRKRIAHGKRDTPVYLYEGIAPDLSILHMHTGRVDSIEAYMLISCFRGGPWYPDMVSATELGVEDAGGFKFRCIKCRRVK